MFRGKTEEFSEKCLFRLGLDAEPRLLREREREGSQVRHFPNAEVKNISRGLHLILV